MPISNVSIIQTKMGNNSYVEDESRILSPTLPKNQLKVNQKPIN